MWLCLLLILSYNNIHIHTSISFIILLESCLFTNICSCLNKEMHVVNRKCILDKNYRTRSISNIKVRLVVLLHLFDCFLFHISIDWYASTIYSFNLKLKTENNKTKQQNSHFCCLVQLVYSFCFVVCIWVSSW